MKNWRTRVEDQGIDIIERGRTVVFARDGIELGRAYPQEYRSGNGGYVFRHVFEVFGVKGKKFCTDLNEVAGCVERVFGW